MSKITIAIAVYNAAKYLSQTLDSIYRSSEQSFDVLICNDGSTDSTCEIIERYQKTHSNIKLIHNDTNRGLEYTRAKMMRLVTTDLVAFCDADDIVHPDRLRKQLEYFDAHPDISVLGSQLRIFYGEEVQYDGAIIESPEHDIDIKAALLYSSTMLIPSVMMRMKDIRATGIEFDTTRRMIEDYDYWVRIAPFVKFANIQEPLVFYRRHEKQITNRNNNWAKQMSFHVKSSQNMLAHYGINIGLEAVQALCFPQHTPPLRVTKRAQKEIALLIQAITHNNFAIPVPLWQQKVLTTRLLPYMSLPTRAITLVRAHRSTKQYRRAVRDSIAFAIRMMIVPFFLSRTIRSMWWFVRYRVLPKGM